MSVPTVHDLNPDGPHSPDYTRRVGETFAEAVRVLAYATRGDAGIVYPSDAYDLLGRLGTGAARLDQVIDQLTRRLEWQLQAGQLTVDDGPYVDDPLAAIAAAAEHLDAARAAANQLTNALGEAQQAISAVSTNDLDEG